MGPNPEYSLPIPRNFTEPKVHVGNAELVLLAMIQQNALRTEITQIFASLLSKEVKHVPTRSVKPGANCGLSLPPRSMRV